MPAVKTAPAKPAKSTKPVKPAPPPVEDDEIIDDDAEGTTTEATDTGDDVVDEGAEEGTEDTATEVDDEFDVQDEPKPAPAKVVPDKSAKAAPVKPAAATGKVAPAKPAAAAPEPSADDTYEPNAAMMTVMIPVDEIKVGKPPRAIDQNHVQSLARSIRTGGLQYAPVIDADMNLAYGFHRFLAMRDVLKYKEIPCRFATDKDGNAISIKSPEMHAQRLVENVQRLQNNPLQTAEAIAAAIKAGVADSAADIAKMTGLTTSQVSRYMTIAESGTKALHEALAADQIGMMGAATLVARLKEPDRIDEQLKTLLAAAEGKTVSRAAVEASAKPTQSRVSGKNSTTKPKSTTLGAEAFATEDTGVSGRLRREGRSRTRFTVMLNLELEFDGETFARYDLSTQAQKVLAKLDGKSIRTELEAGRERLLAT